MCVGGGGAEGWLSQGFSDDSCAINTRTNSAPLCFLSLVRADAPYIIRAVRAISLMHCAPELSTVIHTLGCVASVTSGLHEIRPVEARCVLRIYGDPKQYRSTELHWLLYLNLDTKPDMT